MTRMASVVDSSAACIIARAVAGYRRPVRRLRLCAFLHAFGRSGPLRAGLARPTQRLRKGCDLSSRYERDAGTLSTKRRNTLKSYNQTGEGGSKNRVLNWNRRFGPSLHRIKANHYAGQRLAPAIG